MKAAILYANGDIRYEDFLTPELRPGTVKIKVRASGICGSDIPRIFHNKAHFYPIILGHEFAGDIVEIGEGVKKLKLGDTVTGAPLVPCMKCEDCLRGNYSLCKHYSFIGSRENGSFAEYIVVPESNAVKYDSSLPYTQAAMFEPSTVSLHGLLCNSYQGGGTVAILGGGTIGVFAMQWAKIFGAKCVVVFDINDSRLNLAKRLGADGTVNTIKEDFNKAALDFTDGRGYDYVFETAGQPVTMNMAFDIAGNKSHLCFIGTPHVNLSFTPEKWEKMNRKEFKLTGSWMSYSSPFPGQEWTLTAHFFKTGELKLDPDMIFKEYPLSQAAEAIELFKKPEQVQGKVFLINN